MGVQERREREFRRREGEILGAALSLFGRDDWHAVTIEEIAKTAEIGKGTVYKHFPSKEDIYARLAVDFSRTMLARIGEIDHSAGVLTRLRAMIGVVWEQHLSNREYHRLVLYCERDDFRNMISEASRQLLLQADAEWGVAFGTLVDQRDRRGLSRATSRRS